MQPLILGSSSKYRSRILTNHGIKHIVIKPEIDEKSVGNRAGDPSQLALDVCRAKVEELKRKIGEEKGILICSDQVVSWNGFVREKPESEAQCAEFLRSYATYPAVTHTAVIVVNLRSGISAEGVDVAQQKFKQIPEHVIQQLIQEGDVMYCSGGFVIDSDTIKPYLLERSGTEESIIGMPIHLLHELINKVNN